MKKILVALLLLSTPAFAPAQAADEQPLPCAPKDVCTTFVQADFARYAGSMRKFPLRQDWVDAHWTEMQTAFKPLCHKIGNCLAVPGNSWLFCTDFMRWEFLATAERYPKNSDDWDQWRMAATMWFVGIDKAVVAGHTEAQACANALPAREGKLVVAMKPEKVDANFKGSLVVTAVDAETHVPVMASISVEGQALKPSNDSPNGHPMSFYPFPWTATFTEKHDALGRRSLLAPTVIVKAAGYEPVSFPMPIEVPHAVVEMQPSASQLRSGRNDLTISARDATTGEPIELRVMAGPRVLGDTNKLLVLELKPGQKRPEIWVTSMYKKYSDEVVAPAE